MFDFTSASIPDIDSFLQYFIAWDLSKFWHISVESVPTVGSLWFCTLLGVKIGVSILRQALNI